MSAWEDAVTMAGRPILIDFFCCEGASTGYHRAGFEVFGVDIAPQSNYPFPFHQGDALDVPRRLIDGEAVPFTRPDGSIVLVTLDMVAAIAASPPCQAKTTMSNRYPDAQARWPQLIAPTRELLVETGLPYVIENVAGARKDLRSPVTLNGAMFGLGVDRPRLFESNMPLVPAPRGPKREVIGVYGRSADGRRLWTRTDGTILRAARSVEEGRHAMGIDWMDWRGLAEAIPPAYTEWLGRQLIEHAAVTV
jgi:DNA (cytosine-5)-methyltransferase 1